MPLAKYIYDALNKSEDHRMAKNISRKTWKSLSDSEIERVLGIITQWGRYAELFAYNDKSEEFNLENPE